MTRVLIGLMVLQTGCGVSEAPGPDAAGTSAPLPPACPPDQRCLSGEITYPGPRTGRIYIVVSDPAAPDSEHADTMLGVSIPAPGPFLIRGAQPGTWFLRAFMDLTQTGQRNDPSPWGETPAFTLSSDSVSGLNIALADPPERPVPPPKELYVLPVDGGAVVDWTGDDTWYEAALSYNVFWSTESTVGPDFTPGGGGRRGLPARRSENFWVNTGLENGQSYYFAVQAQVDDRVGPPSQTVGPVTIGAPKGGNTVRGVVHFDGYAPVGPLLLSTIDNLEEGQVWQVIPHPVSPQAFELQGLSDGLWEIVAMMDRDRDGQIWKTDPSYCFFDGEFAPFMEVGATPLDLAIRLDTIDAYRSVRSVHWTDGQREEYRVRVHVRQGLSLPVNVTLLESSRVPAVVDLHGFEVHYVHGKVWEVTVNTGAVRPQPEDTWTLGIEYEGGATEEVTLPGPLVSDLFAIPVHPVGAVPGETEPTFQWTDPGLPVVPDDALPSARRPSPNGYLYRVVLLGGAGAHGGPAVAPSEAPTFSGGNYLAQWWTSPVMDTTHDSAEYNFAEYPRRRLRAEEPRGHGRPLVAGEEYVWQIETRDPHGNSALYETRFRP